MTDPLKALADEGVSIWLDDLSRHRLVSGDLERRVLDGQITGVTTNPAIFHNALREAEVYEPRMRELAHLGLSAEETIRVLTVEDVRAACDLLRPVYEAGTGQDGRVSIEVDPRSAHDTARTVAEAGLLWWLVDRPNVMIKIPATDEGLPALTECLARGISVNVTLIFSLERYREVLRAYLDGMEQAKANGHDLSVIASVASFFVSRVDTEVDRRLGKLGDEVALDLRGRAAIANATLAYRLYEQVLAGERWQRLAGAGAHPQRPLWASTGVKNPDYEDTRYVIDLVAPGTVNTVPEATLAAVMDHGVVRGDRVTPNYAAAAETFDRLAAVGVDMADVVIGLEQAGVAAFRDAWCELIADVASATAAWGADR